jgi:aspartate ammonia-lyase
LKRLAVKLSKICNDLRLLASGPRCGLNEINLPPMAPGSSIMPGKVNPVIPEVTNQTCFKVIGNDTTVMIAAEAGQLQLNVMEPIITECLIEDLTWLPNAMDTLREKCIDGITVNKERCLEMVKHSIGIVTALNPYIGYKNSTKIAKEALETGGSVYDLVLEKKILTKEKLDAILNPEHMLDSTDMVK